MALTKEKKDALIKKFKRHETDSGSTELQISLLTERIRSIVDHLKNNKKDHHGRRGLLVLVGKRKRLLNYLERSDGKKFESLTKTLGL